MKLKFSCSSFLLMFSLYGIAQNDYRPGYIITNNRDTLYGKINYQNDESLGGECAFKADSDSVFVFYPSQILAYRFIEGRYFVSRTYKQDKVFLEYLINGIVSLYFLKDHVGDHFFIEKDTIPLTELSYNETIKVINGKQYISETKGYLNQLDYFMQDAQGILPKIKAISKPQHRELIKLTEYYHNLVCTDESCIIYNKTAPFLKISLEPFLSIGKFFHIEKPYIAYGGYINLQSSYEKLYFRTGLFHYEFDDTSDENFFGGEPTSMNQIPLQVHYINGNGKFKTRIGIGYDLLISNKKGQINDKNKFAGLSPNFNFGIINKITNSTDLSIGINIQTIPYSFRLLYLSLDFGLRFNLSK